MIPDKALKSIIDFTIGDGSLRKQTETHTAVFKMEHSIKQREYLWHKVEVLRNFGLKHGEESIQTRIVKGKEYQTVNYKFHVNPIFNTAYKWCYNQGRKSFDKALINQLDDVSLAYWFMDDGSGPKTYVSKSKVGGVRYEYKYPQPKIERYTLSTYSCTLDELHLIQDWLLGSFNVKCNISVDKRGKTCYSAYLAIAGVTEKDKFRKVIEPYVIPSMRYKIEGAHTFEGMKYVSVQRDRLSEDAPDEN